MFTPRVKTMNGKCLVVFRDNKIWNIYEYSENNLESLKVEIKADLKDCCPNAVANGDIIFADKDGEMWGYSNTVFRAYMKGHEFDRAGEYYRIQRY